MGRKRKLFTGSTPIGGCSVKSRRIAREITSKFHELNNRLAQSQEKNERNYLEQEIQRLGGRGKYQEASIISTQHHKVSGLTLSEAYKYY